MLKLLKMIKEPKKKNIKNEIKRCLYETENE